MCNASFSGLVMPCYYYKLTVNFPTLKSLFFQLWFNLFASKGQLNASQQVTLTILLIALSFEEVRFIIVGLRILFILGTVQMLQDDAHYTFLPPGNQWVFCVQINFYWAITFNPRCNSPAQLNNFLFYTGEAGITSNYLFEWQKTFFSSQREMNVCKEGREVYQMRKVIFFLSPIYILWYNLVGGHSLSGGTEQTEWIIFEIIYRFFRQNGSFRPLASPSWSRAHRQ